MIYTLIGRLVVRAAKVFLRRKYGRALVPKPVVAGGLVAVMIGVLLLLGRRERSAS